MKYSKTLSSVALSALLLLGVSGCNSSDNPVAVADDPAPAAEETISPYERVAVIQGNWADVNGIADKIAQYVTLTDEDTDLGFDSGGWLIAGAKTANNGGTETYETTDLLPIPAMGVASDLTPAIEKKSRVIEFCNGKYAKMAMGTGLRHGPALPCEVSVHSDGENIFIDMLDADAIFSIFFHDITDDGTLKDVASKVKNELRTMVLAALDDSVTVAGNVPVDDVTITATEPIDGGAVVAYEESTEALGPKFSNTDISDSVSYRDPYIVFKYVNGTNAGGTFTKDDAKNLAKDIIATLGTDAATADTNVPGLSAGSAWRSARPEPLEIPGVFTAEACSPKYAKKATTLGNEYLTALPCEITVYVDDEDDSNQTLAISFLNPNFMFGTMFDGAVDNALANGTIDKDGAIEYSTLADVVFADLRMIVDSAVQDHDGTGEFNTKLNIVE